MRPRKIQFRRSGATYPIPQAPAGSRLLPAGLSTRFNPHIIARGLVQRVLCVVFAAEPLDPVTSILGGGETTQRTLFVRLLSSSTDD